MPRSAGHINVIDRALVDVVGDRGTARPIIGILTYAAWAKHIAITCFQNTAIEFVAHISLHASCPTASPSQ
ncbi:hypothetical protein BN2476_1130010 [Paraburkholderia piptadeniae]|uniref:Uncharacterized protein n=1 Tax=Paraburkholderia piptadeniae TaxID=1701573 RepID=A0A1N7SV84_9BURK|nr:hypothetical protein BN2476_1130010 [Paraburkholderia piptadeniae]